MPRKKRQKQLECPEQLRDLLVPIDSIRPDPDNPRTAHDIEAISASLRELGWHAPIVVDTDGVVSVHHGCLEAARQLGQKKVPVLRIDEDRARALARNVADNAAGEGSMFDIALLGAALEQSPVLVDMAVELKLDEYVPIPGVSETEQENDGPSEDDLSENNEKLKRFIDSREKSRARGADKADANFWLCLVFQSTNQKLSFLKAIGDPETKYGMYVDGVTLAHAMKIEIAPHDQKPHMSPLDASLVDMVKS